MENRVLRSSGRHTVAGNEQAENILRCARRVLRDQGAGSFSVRKVAQAAGISIGHLQHYFGTRADLLRAVLVAMEQRFHDDYARAVTGIEDPMLRLDACANYLLEDGKANNATSILRELWSLADRDEAVAASLDDFYEGFRRFTTTIIRDASPELDAVTSRHISSTLIATLSGAFIFLGTQTDEQEKHALLSYLRALPVQLLSTARKRPFATAKG